MTDDAVFISGFTFIPSYVVHMWSKMNSDTCSDFACGRNIDVGIQIGNRVAPKARLPPSLQRHCEDLIGKRRRCRRGWVVQESLSGALIARAGGRKECDANQD
jgi:hypothetical protein